MEFEALNKQIEELCVSKAEEFALIGYENVTGEEIWKCVSEINKYVDENLPPIHQIVNDILTLKPTKFMNWLTLNAYKGFDL